MMRRLLVALATVSLVAGVAATLSEPAAAQGSLKMFFQKGFKDDAWQKTVYDRVRSNWKPKAFAPVGKKTVLIAVVSKDGKVTGLRDHQVAGVAGWDGPAIEAVRKSIPFPPLPDSWPHGALEVHFHFEVVP